MSTTLPQTADLAIDPRQPGGGERRHTHLPFLDGLRGLAAFYVVLSHLVAAGLPPWAAALTRWARYGHAAVGVFIVLSGYCLMLPVARSSSGTLRGGWRDYLLRRAKRILPPYYAALLLSLPIEYLHQRDHGRGVDPGAVISHLLLLHNLSARWNMALDIPMWSVATEWQIYFFLPLLFLPLWRRFGMPVVVAAAFTLGLLPHFLLPAGRNFDWACPWYLGVFTLGMAGAVLTERALPAAAPWAAAPARWLAAAALLLVAIVAAYRALQGRIAVDSFATDTLIGLCATALIVACTLAARAPAAPRWTRAPLSLLQTRAAETLGAFSYSLYLTHSLVYFSIGWLLNRHVHSPVDRQAAYYVLLLPLMLALAYLFYLLFERPLMRTRDRLAQQSGSAA